MFVVALVLLLLAALLFVVGVFGGSDAANLDLGPINIDTNSTVIFFLGMLTLFLVASALGLLRAAARRAAAQRRDRKEVGELSSKLEEYQRDDRDHRDRGDRLGR